MMDILTADLECFYDNDYTLSKMTTESYLRDPRYSEIMWSLKWNAEPAFWVLPERADQFFRTEVDWNNTALIHQHAHFDGAALNWHHGVRPALFVDTLSMARVLDGPKAGNSLRDLCIRHGVGFKGDFVTYAKGKRLADFTRDELRQYGEYCCNDTDRTYDLAQIFLPQLPANELRLIDLTVRMFTEPVFVGDTERLRGAVAAERQRKVELLRRIGQVCPTCSGIGTLQDLVGGNIGCKDCSNTGVNKKAIGSNEQFANLLRAAGVEPETKMSATTGEQIYAFAKTDSFMQGLLEDEDEQVRFLAEARIGVKSNIVETRAQRFLHCAERGLMPVYLAHAGAHTLRCSGGDGMNWLNMSKQIEGMARPEMAVLRQSIQAPHGHKIVAVDSSQGEARILAWLAGQQDLVEAFRAGRDVYSEHASLIYGRPVDRKRVAVDHIPGQVGKVEILSSGFGCGWYKKATEFLKGTLGAPPIQFTAKDIEAMSVDPSQFLNSPTKVARVDAMPSRLELNDRLIHCIVADALVKRYRAKMDKICGNGGFWERMEAAIGAMIEGSEMVFGAHGVMTTGKECIHMPGGHTLHYRGIERDDEGNASYFDGHKRQKIYGSLLTENIVQCMHRIIVGDQLVQIGEVCKVALWPYDEIVCVVPDDSAELSLQFMVETMKREPAWAVGLPLAAEGGIGNTYAEC